MLPSPITPNPIQAVTPLHSHFRWVVFKLCLIFQPYLGRRSNLTTAHMGGWSTSPAPYWNTHWPQPLMTPPIGSSFQGWYREHHFWCHWPCCCCFGTHGCRDARLQYGWGVLCFVCFLGLVCCFLKLPWRNQLFNIHVLFWYMEEIVGERDLCLVDRFYIVEIYI